MISYRAKMSAWSPLAAADPLAGSGLGTAAITLGALTLASSGKALAKGSAAISLGALTLSATGTVPLHATLGVTLGAVTLAATGGIVYPGINGTLGVTLGAVALVSSGNVPLHGALAASLDAMTMTGVGSVLDRAAFAATLGSIVLVGRGTVANQVFHGTLHSTLGALALSSGGSVTSAPRNAALYTMLGAVRLSALGHIVIIPTSWPHEWCPMPGPTRSKARKVDQVELGDGYVYRLTRGLHPVATALTYAFPFEDMEHLGEMDAFLRAHGSRGFLFKPPELVAPVYVCCDQWSATLIERTGSAVVGQLRSTFQRRFNPMPGNPI
jgi:phage-related protein